MTGQSLEKTLCNLVQPNDYMLGIPIRRTFSANNNHFKLISSILQSIYGDTSGTVQVNY